MRQDDSPERIRLGSLTAIREKNFGGFSIAEMVVVMLIMSLIVIGIPAIHFKKTELKTKRSLHGRFECYYAGETLQAYYTNEEGADNTPAVTGSECTFTPPKNATYLLVHAVGGGGGGAPGGSINIINKVDGPNTYTTANDFPEWMKDVQGSGHLPESEVRPPSYTGKRQGSYATITYGNAGKAGETKSMFFPKLTNTKIIMKPGKGGLAGHPGFDTVVEFENAQTSTLTAKGGAAGSGTGQYPVWLDGDTPMCTILELEGRKGNPSDFTESIEMDEDTKMISKVQASAGSGGEGSYGNATGTYTVRYTIKGGPSAEEVDVSDYVSKPSCDVSSCGTGNCTAGNGQDGAVVILW